MNHNDIPDFLKPQESKMEVDKNEKIIALDTKIKEIEDKIKYLQEAKGKLTRERRSEMSRLVTKILHAAK